MKQSPKAMLVLFLRNCLETCFIYWLVFCLVDYVHHHQFFLGRDLILAAIFCPILPLLRCFFTERNGGSRKTMP